MANQKVNVLLFEDNNDLREVLVQLINESVDFYCSGAFPDTLKLRDCIQMSDPGLVIMDIDLPFVNGIESTRILKSDNPQLPVMILTVFEDDVKIFNAICAGANGYLLKNSRPEKILDSMREILQGGAPMSPMVARKVLETFKTNTSRENEKQYDLSVREREILELLTQGLSYKLIAARCNISLDTVKYHAKNIYEKLQVHSKSEAVILAIRNRLV